MFFVLFGEMMVLTHCVSNDSVVCRRYPENSCEICEILNFFYNLK